MIYIAVLCNSTESLQNGSAFSPSSLDPMPLPQYGALAWRPLQGTKLYCLVNRGTLGVNNLPRVVARIMPRPESNPRPLDHESDALPLHYRATNVIIVVIQNADFMCVTETECNVVSVAECSQLLLWMKLLSICYWSGLWAPSERASTEPLSLPGCSRNIRWT